MYGQHEVMNNGTMDWRGNLYSYHFVDKVEDQKQVRIVRDLYFIISIVSGVG
jgi:hypothetical protein